MNSKDVLGETRLKNGGFDEETHCSGISFLLGQDDIEDAGNDDREYDNWWALRLLSD